MNAGHTLTAPARQTGVAVAQTAAGPQFSPLIADMDVADGTSLSRSRLLQPSVEVGLAFLIDRPVLSETPLAQALRAVAGVALGLRIVHPDGATAGLVLGPWTDPHSDLSNRGFVLSVDGVPRVVGSTAAILGNPLRALVAAARDGIASARALQPGWTVWAGTTTPPLDLAHGRHVQAAMQAFGQAGFCLAD